MKKSYFVSEGHTFGYGGQRYEIPAGKHDVDVVLADFPEEIRAQVAVHAAGCSLVDGVQRLQIVGEDPDAETGEPTGFVTTPSGLAPAPTAPPPRKGIAAVLSKRKK